MLIWSSVSFFIRAMRWRVLLRSQKYISPLIVFWANMAGYFGNAMLPARAGEIVRAAYVARHTKIPATFAFATGITERLVDLAALVFISAGSLFFADAFQKPVEEALQSFAIVAILGAVLFFFLPLFKGFINRIFDFLPFLSWSLKDKLHEMTHHFVDGVKVIACFERGIPFLLFTAFIWLMDGFGMVIFASALHETLTLPQAFLFIATLGISSAIPSTPGYVGVYQFVAVTVLVPFGFARESALVLILLSQMMNLLIVSLWGSVGLWIGSREIFTYEQDSTEAESHD